MKKSLLILLVAIFLLVNPTSVMGRNIKIGLKTSSGALIGSNINAKLVDLSTNKTVLDISGNSNIKLNGKNGEITFKKGKELISTPGPLRLIPNKKNGFVRLNNKSYRGNFLIIPSLHSKEKITVINDVDLEEYLLSVVPSEMPYKWHLEALKAQAVAARSYSLGYLGRRKEKGYDLEATVQDQVYHGISSEKPATTQAVKSTKNQILLNEKGEPLITFFHSSAGGYTDSIENIWSHMKNVKPSKHIQPKPDYDNKSPFFNWKRSYSKAKLNNLLKELGTGKVTGITTVNKLTSGRVQKVKISGTTGEKTINGEEFRMLLKLPSSRFNYSSSKDNYKFTGKGYGHGLGLSQWGAKALAEKGKNYKKILSHYYSDAKLITLKPDFKK